ncbi:MAG TPA: c-type cytochrome domain-containing protein, partial [Gemmata sp.]|nr:c-type cytochrome domain-containing protein [Gemmata sp.]
TTEPITPATPTQPVTITPNETPAPKPPMPMVTTPPKVDPKPPMPVVSIPPKTDPPKDIKAISFKTEVLPILRTHCLNCHGAVGKPKGDVDLTSFVKLMKSQSPGKIVVPGKPEQSDIYTSITEREMPSGGKPKPSEKELLVLKNWILSGAKERRRSIRNRNRIRVSRA